MRRRPHAAPRFSLLLVVWLAVTSAGASGTLRSGLRTGDDEAPPLTTTSPTVPSPSSAPPLASPVRVMPQSQCAACRDWATCDLAYRSRPGKFCWDLWWTGRPCCCPMGSQCVWDATRCLCKDMLFGEKTPMIVGCAVGAIVFVGLLICLKECIYPSPPSSSGSGGGSGGSGGGGGVSESSHVFVHDNTNYGSTFSGDTGGSGSTFAGDSGGDGGSFAGDS